MNAMLLTVATAAIFLAARRKLSMGVSAVISGLFLAWAAKGITGGLQTLAISLYTTFIKPEGFNILLAVVFINMLGNVMRASGAMDELVYYIRMLSRDTRKLVFLIPSFTTLVAGPGAGVLPAPLLDPVGDEIGLSQEKKTVATIVFRHMWYSVYPIYTPFILLEQTSGMPYSALLLPAITSLIVVGLVSTRLVFRDLPVDAAESAVAAASETASNGVRSILHAIGKMLFAAIPLVVLVVLRIGFKVSFTVSCGLSCICAVLPMSAERPFFSELKRRIIEGAIPGFNWKVMETVAGVLFFSHVVVNSGLVSMLAPALSGHALSLVILSVIVPFAIGFMIGSHIGTVGLALPLLLPLTQANPETGGFLALFYLSSLMGYMVSPVHVCFIGTLQCLNAELKEAWRMLVVCGVAGFIVCLAFGVYWSL